MRNADAVLFLILYITLGMLGLVMSNSTIAVLFIAIVGIMFPYGTYKVIKLILSPLKRVSKWYKKRRKDGTTKMKGK